MPLPDDGAKLEWPPRECQEANRLYATWGAWYAGDPQELARVYSTTIGYADPKYTARPAQYAGGLLGLAARMFWGAPPPQGSLALSRLHVPLASDIAATSSDLLFGEQLQFVVPDVEDPLTDPTQQRMDVLMEEGGVHAALLEAGEVCSAYGGVYLRVGWDKAVADHALLDALPPDAAVPEWRSGRLTAVTFWRQLRDLGDGRVYRHLERHEPGRIQHGLFASTSPERLGVRRDLRDHPDTAAYAEVAGPSGQLETGAEGLTAEYVPNMRPNRALRGSPLGRSDYAGIEPVLDSLDEAWTSWMRDLRIGKGRIMVPDVWVTSRGRGGGAYFDAEQDVFMTVNALPGGNGALNQSMSAVQFQIRVAEHQTTCTDLTAQAVRGAGYSVQTFGEAADVAATATEVVARERRTYTTRGRKIEYWRPRLSRLWEVFLAVDAKVFGSKVTPVRPDIEWPDGVAIDPEQQARTIQLLDAAKAISTRTKVAMLHPDWDDDRVEEEADLIDKAGMPEVPPPGAATSGNQPDPTEDTAEDDQGGSKRQAGRQPPGRQRAGRRLTAVGR